MSAKTGIWQSLFSFFTLSETKSLTQTETKPETVKHGANWVQPYGVRPKYNQAEAMSAYAGHGYTYAAVSRASQDLAALPLRLLKGKDKVLIEDSPVIDLMNNPSTNTDGFLFREQICTDLILTGNCYILLLGPSDTPVSIVRLHPQNVRVQTDQTGITGYVYESGGQRVQYPPDRIVHGRLASWSNDPSMTYGTGAIEPLSRELTADINSQNLVSNASAKARPDVLISPSDPADIWGAEMRRDIASEYRKLSENGGAMVLSGLAQVNPLQLSPREMEYTKAREMARESISAVTGVPPTVLGLPSANYALSRQQARNYWSVQTKRGKRLALLFTEIAKRFDKELTYEHDYSGVEALQDTRTEQLNRVQLHILNGVSPRSAYKYEGLEYPDDVNAAEADLTDEAAEDTRAFIYRLYAGQITKAKEDELATGDNKREAFNELSDSVQTALTDKANSHNDEYGDDPRKRTTKETLAVVWWRGRGAYFGNPESVRPTVSSADQWAMARVNGFLYALRTLKFRRGKFDTDLLPSEHPLSTDKDEQSRHLLFGYRGLKLAPKDENWGFTARESNAILGDNDYETYSKAFLFVYAGREDEPRGYRLPIAKLIDGELQIVYRGVIAAGSALRKEPKFNTGFYNLNGISDRDIKRLYGIIEALYSEFDETAPPLDLKGLKSAVTSASDNLVLKAEDEKTDFPKAGDTLEVSLDNSAYPIFDPDYAEDLKANYPEIWAAGGNIEGNNQYRRLKPIVSREDKTPQTRTEELAIRKREAWAARHFRDGAQFDTDNSPSANLSSIAGIVAQIKWYVVGELGQTKMKSVIDEVKSKIDKEIVRRDTWRLWIKRIVSPAQRDIQLAVSAYLKGAARRYEDRVETYVTEPVKVSKGVVDYQSLLAQSDEIQLLIQQVGPKLEQWFYTSGNDTIREIAKLLKISPEGITLGNDYLENYYEVFSRQVVNTMSNSVKTAVETGLIEGLPVKDIARNIRVNNAFSEFKALQIAQTESTRSANLGAQQAYTSAAAAGVPVRKQWLSSRDNKVRDTHIELDFQIVGANEDFTIPSTGETAFAPCQFGSAEQDINCRCGMLPVIDEGVTADTLPIMDD